MDNNLKIYNLNIKVLSSLIDYSLGTEISFLSNIRVLIRLAQVFAFDI